MHTHSHTEGTRGDTLRHTNIPCGVKRYGPTDSRPSILINSALVPLPTVCVKVKSVSDSGDRLVTVCTNDGSRTSGGTHLRLVHTGRLTHSWFHQWEFTALTATTANHITAHRCFTMTTHYSMLHFIQLGLPRLKIQHTKAVGRERVFWGYAHRQRSVNRPKGATCMLVYVM